MVSALDVPMFKMKTFDIFLQAAASGVYVDMAKYLKNAAYGNTTISAGATESDKIETASK